MPTNSTRPFSIVSRVGRPPLYPDPEDLARVADEYFQWCDDNPFETATRKLVGAKQTGKGGEAKSDETKFTTRRAYTLDGFCLFARISDWSSFKSAEAHSDAEYLAVIHAIEQTIRDQQVSGALAGVFNSNIVARLNGIADKTDLNVNTEQQQSAEDALKALKGQK